MLVACSYKTFPHTEDYSLFHSNSFNKTRSKYATEDVRSITFNSKVSIIVDDYLFNKETVMTGLKRKREPENIVGTKKSKKRLRRL